MMNILVNRDSLNRAIANARRMPMTDEQRRAMFARLRGGGGQDSGSYVQAPRTPPYPPGARRQLTPQQAAAHAATLRGDIERLLTQNQNMLEMGEREELQRLLGIVAGTSNPEAVFTDTERWTSFTSYVDRHILDAHREPTPGREPFVQFMYHIAQVAEEMGKPLPYTWYSLAGGSGRAPSASRVYDGPLMVPTPAGYPGGVTRRSSAPVTQPPADTQPPPRKIVLPIDRPYRGNPPDDRKRLRPWTTR